MELEALIKQYNISDVDIKKNMLQRSENAYRTSAKELICRKIVKRFGLCKRYIEENDLGEFTGYKWVTNKKQQLSGIDIQVFYTDRFGNEKTVNIDLKGCVGNYPYAVVEITQNMIFTNTKSKATDVVLYVAVNNDGTVKYRFVDYATICKISLDYKPTLEMNGDVCFFKFKPEVKVSNNKSGHYVVVKELPIDQEV